MTQQDFRNMDMNEQEEYMLENFDVQTIFDNMVGWFSAQQLEDFYCDMFNMYDMDEMITMTQQDFRNMDMNEQEEYMLENFDVQTIFENMIRWFSAQQLEDFYCDMLNMYDMYNMDDFDY